MNEILYQSQQERRSDSRSELKNKRLRVLLLQIHRAPAAVRAVQAAVPVRIPSMQVDESNQDRSERQKVSHGADMELVGLVMESP